MDADEKSRIAELRQKQALQVAAIRNRKNTNQDQSKIPRSASNSVWDHSRQKRQEIPSGAATLTQLSSARNIVTCITPQLARLLCRVRESRGRETGRW